MLRIIRITSKIDKRSFNAEDVFTAEPVIISLSGKKRMYLDTYGLTKGSECIAQFSPYELTRGQFVTPSDFKMDNTNDNWIAQKALQTRYEAEIGPYNPDVYWIKRAKN